jgi:hypothetical protein
MVGELNQPTNQLQLVNHPEAALEAKNLPLAHCVKSSLRCPVSNLCSFQCHHGSPEMASKVHDMSTTNHISLMSSMFNDMSCTFEASFMMILNPGLNDLMSVYFECSNHVAHNYSKNLNTLCAANIKNGSNIVIGTNG